MRIEGPANKHSLAAEINALIYGQMLREAFCNQ
jgi:hypothetical protein